MEGRMMDGCVRRALGVSQSWLAQEGVCMDISLGETTEWTLGRIDRASSKEDGGDMDRGSGWRAAKAVGEKAESGENSWYAAKDDAVEILVSEGDGMGMGDDGARSGSLIQVAMSSRDWGSKPSISPAPASTPSLTALAMSSRH